MEPDVVLVQVGDHVDQGGAAILGLNFDDDRAGGCRSYLFLNHLFFFALGRRCGDDLRGDGSALDGRQGAQFGQ